MSLVSAVIGKQLNNSATSEWEDKVQTLQQAVTNIANQGSELGPLLAGIDGEIQNGRYAIMQLQSRGMAYANNPNDPNAAQGAAVVQQRIEYLCRNDAVLRQKKNQMAIEQRVLANQERKLQSQLKQAETMQRLCDGMLKTSEKIENDAIGRMFSGNR